MSNGWKHLIYDMDGTLADTAKATIAACERVRHRHGLPPLSDALIRSTIGYANPEFYQRLYPDQDRARVEAFGAEVEAEEVGIVRRLGEDILFPSMKETLLALRDAGILLYVASTGDLGHVEVVLGSAGIKGLFAEVFCGEPEKVAMVGRLIGGDTPKRWAMIGDMQKDLDAARGNGIAAIAAGYGYYDPAECQGFDHVLHAPGEIMRLL